MAYTSQQLTKLSKHLSKILRHEPWLYELELDDEGWVSVDALLQALRSDADTWYEVNLNDLADMIARSDKKRHEIKDAKIRALYGHSIPGKLIKMPTEPPIHLYHGTSPSLIEQIKSQGLLPMSRQYVHLSSDRQTAEQVGRRKALHPIMLTVRAHEAYQNNLVFYHGNEMIWLADHIPPDYIDFSS